jgi:hypothetical protein
LKKDLRVFKLGLEGLLMPSFFLLIRIILKKLVIIRKREGTSTLGERSMSDSLIHAPLGSGRYCSVGRAPLLQLDRCDYKLDV